MLRRSIWNPVLVLTMAAIAAFASGTAHAQMAASPNVIKLDHPEPLRTPAGQSTPEVSSLLKIGYAGKQEQWTVATLAALPHTTVTLYNEHAKASQSYSGVPLAALLTRLGIADKPHGKDLRLYLVAEGSDGYGVTYSIGEVTPDLHDGTTLVADAVDGKPLADSGPFQLVTTGDKRPARWVRNLVSVRVLPAQ